MKKAILLSLAAVMTIPLASLDALAHPSPSPHYHTRREVNRHTRHRHVRVYRPHYRRRPPVVIIETPPPPPVVIVEEAPPERVYVERAPAPPARTVIRREEPTAKSSRRNLLGVGVRVLGSSLEGGKLGLKDGENPTMGGIGIQLRTRFGDNLGMELSTDFLSGEGDDVSQRTIPVMAALTYHLLPTSRLQPYLLAGAGVHFTRLEYLDGRYNYDMTEIAGQLGAGVEIFLTKNLSLQADVRAQTIFKNLDTQAKIRQDCLNQVGDMVGFCDGINRADPDDKGNLGVQFQAGATWYF